MIDYFTYLVEASVCMLVLHLFYLGALAGQKHFNLNRFYLLGSILISVLIPIINIPVFLQNPSMSLFVEELQTISINADTRPAASGYIFTIPNLILFTYLSGVLFLFIRFIRQLFRILGFISQSDLEERDGYNIVHTKHVSFGSFMHYIFYNETSELSISEKEKIIAHEAVHVREWHTLDILILELLKIIFWFNPVIYFIKSSLREVHEYIADEIVSGKNSGAYLKLIAKQALVENGFSLTSNFNKSQILKRMDMLNKQKQKLPLIRLMIIIPLLAGLVVVFSCEPANGPLASQENNESEDLENPGIQGSGNDKVFTKVDDQPVFPGGTSEFFEYVTQNFQYPEEARQNGIEGKVFIQFVVDKEGHVTNLKVLKGIGYGCDTEALRIMKESPQWLPGKHNGQKVAVRMVMPIVFKL